jgi:hypothetical protein
MAKKVGARKVGARKAAARNAAKGAAVATQSRLDTIKIGSRVFKGKGSKVAGRRFDILPDMPDIRDRIYIPTLRPLRSALKTKVSIPVLDQGTDQSCTGFSLAQVVDILRSQVPGSRKLQGVSPRMLYEMAKRNDEWAGTAYDGSSLRGAIKGFFGNGVCRAVTAPDVAPGQDWALTYEMAKEAREIRLGAYLRLQPDISDYHAALNEIGVIYASAQIHSNWTRPKDGKIVSGGTPLGGHAFAIVGYDDKGFLVLNSWSGKWGNRGIAHWTYTDWAESVMDAWVLQLGVRAPEAFGAVPRATPSTTTGLFGFDEPNRGDVLGHFINIDDGRYVTDGKYGSPTKLEMEETVKRLTNANANDGKGYDHLVIYGHGGLNSLGDAARRIAVWKRTDVFGRNKIYHFHLMWGSGFLDEVFGEVSKSSAVGRVGGFFDPLFEAGPGKAAGTHAWRNMKIDARISFEKNSGFDGGFTGLEPLLKGIDRAPPARRPKLHLVGHSAGSIVLGYLLSALKRFNLVHIDVDSIHLMAPACTADFFNEHYKPYLAGAGARPLQDKVYLYNLTDQLELDDTVSLSAVPFLGYSRSLLYLVSRAYEEKPTNPIPGAPNEMPLAGMQRFVSKLPSQGAKFKIDLAAKTSSVTASTSHGGFDNDAPTLTTIMSRILGKNVPEPPLPGELTGY